MSGVTQVRLTVSDEEADEMAQRVYKTLLKPAPDDARAQLEELALRHQPGEYAAGEQLRAVAAELVGRGLEVTAVDYRDGSQELEVALSPGGRRARSPWTGTAPAGAASSAGRNGWTSPMRPG